MFKLRPYTSPLRSGLVAVALAAGLLALTGCSSGQWGFPYKVGVQQGNWITKDQVALLQPGMTREQVRFALGTPTLTSALRVFFDLTAIGLFGGIFIVPLYALVQSRTASNKRARVLAANNVLNALFMVAGAAVGIVCLSVIQMSIPLFFLTVSLANLVFLCLLLWRVPEFKTRFLTWRIQ